MEITAGVYGDPTYVIEGDPVLIITDSALDAMRERDLTEYMEIIHEIDERWEAEWDHDSWELHEGRS